MSSTFHPSGDARGEAAGGHESRTDPGYAAELGIRSAPTGRRALAFIIDLAGYLIVFSPGIVAISIAATSVVAGTPPFSSAPVIVLLSIGYVLAAIYLLVQLIVHGARGITIGKALTGIRSVNVVTLARPGFWRVVFRGLLWTLSGVVIPVVGAVVVMSSAWWGERGRGWLDRIGSTWLVDIRHGINPYDVKQLRLAKKRVDTPPVEALTPVPSLATGADSIGELAARARSRSSVVGHASVFGALRSPDVIERSAAPVRAPVIAPPSLSFEPVRSEGEPAVASARPASHPRTASTMTTAAVLVGDDGSTVRIGTWAVVGRAPALRPEESGADPVAIDDPEMSLSKTHAAVGVDAAGLWIEDRGSSNGTTVGEGDAELDVPVGVRVRVPWGSRLTLGSRGYRALERRIDG